jgi:hypothetical protein
VPFSEMNQNIYVLHGFGVNWISSLTQECGLESRIFRYMNQNIEGFASLWGILYGVIQSLLSADYLKAKS